MLYQWCYESPLDAIGEADESSEDGEDEEDGGDEESVVDVNLAKQEGLDG